MNTIRTRGAVLITALLAVGGLTLTTAPAANADEKEKDGNCSAQSDWELDLEKDDGEIDVEFDVDTPSEGKTWRVSVIQNGDVKYTGTRVTDDDGDFDVDLDLRDQAGTDRIVVRAKQPASGEVCRGALSI